MLLDVVVLRQLRTRSDPGSSPSHLHSISAYHNGLNRRSSSAAHASAERDNAIVAFRSHVILSASVLTNDYDECSAQEPLVPTPDTTPSLQTVWQHELLTVTACRHGHAGCNDSWDKTNAVGCIIMTHEAALRGNLQVYGVDDLIKRNAVTAVFEHKTVLRCHQRRILI
jgi:hypothetical protein